MYLAVLLYSYLNFDAKYNNASDIFNFVWNFTKLVILIA